MSVLDQSIVCYPLLNMLLVTEHQWETQLNQCWLVIRVPLMSSSNTSTIEDMVMQCNFLGGWFEISRLEVNEVKALPPTSSHGVTPQSICLAYTDADGVEDVCIGKMFKLWMFFNSFSDIISSADWAFWVSASRIWGFYVMCNFVGVFCRLPLGNVLFFNFLLSVCCVNIQ